MTVKDKTADNNILLSVCLNSSDSLFHYCLWDFWSLIIADNMRSIL